MLFTKQEGKKVGIFGLGITGLSVYRSLLGIAKELIVYDDALVNRELFAKEYGQDSLTDLSDDKWKGLDKIVVSPGVASWHRVFHLADDNKISISSDIELLIEENPDSDYVFVTGTNGKSTVTALIGHVLSLSGLDYQVGGNIGKAVADLPCNSKGYVLELSSFQIDLLNINKLKQFFGGNFSKQLPSKQQLRAYSNDLENWNEKQEASERSVPFVRESASSSQFFGGNFSKQQSMVVITNITPDHLDRYDDVASYVKSKEKILIKDALKIIGINSPISKDIYSSLKDKGEGGVIPISVLESVENGVFYDKNTDCLVDNTGENNTGENNTGKKEVIFPMALLPNLVGMHNKENIAIAYAVCKALAVDGDSIIRALESFKGLAHRMEYVGSYKNISFYNDSKATNITSALASLSSFQNIIWFAGGKFKENSFESLIPILKNIKMAYFFGESKNLFANFFENNQNNNYQICLNLEEAFDKALEYSLKTEEKLVFLLAPACSSYDQFRDFEERGKLFVKMVQSIVF